MEKKAQELEAEVKRLLAEAQAEAKRQEIRQKEQAL